MKTKLMLVFLIFVINLVFSGCNALQFSDIEDMSDHNYINILKENEAVLVYFHADDSKRCQEMNLEISKLHAHIAGNKLEVKLVKVDVAKWDNVAVEFGVESIPKLKFIRYRYKIKNDYEGKPSFEEILKFVNK